MTLLAASGSSRSLIANVNLSRGERSRRDREIASG
jgi:hypothetical protein